MLIAMVYYSGKIQIKINNRVQVPPKTYRVQKRPGAGFQVFSPGGVIQTVLSSPVMTTQNTTIQKNSPELWCSEFYERFYG